MLANVFFYRSHARARSRSGGNMGTLPATLEAISSQARPLVASEVTRVSPSAKRWFIRTRRGMGRAGVAPQAGAPYGAMPGQQQVGSMGGRRTDMAAIRAQQEIMDVHHSFGGSGGGRPPSRGAPHDQARLAPPPTAACVAARPCRQLLLGPRAWILLKLCR